MAKKKQKKKSDSTKRFGTRYGRKLKEKLSEVEAGHRGRHKCPYCNKKNAKRLAIGIWTCTACHTKFVGRAYSIGKKQIAEEPKEEKAPKKVKKEVAKNDEL